MKRIGCILITAFLSLSHLSCGPVWTEETARKEAFRDVNYNIDITQYPASDPDFQENQNALKTGRGRVGNRFVSSNPEPPVGYVVSTLDKKGHPIITMFYRKDGSLLSVRLFSRPEYPRVAYIYSVEAAYQEMGKEFKPGELLSVSFHISGREAFYFNPDGQCTGHVKF